MSHRALSRTGAAAGKRLSPYSTQLTELEIASGIVLGNDPEAPPLPEADPSLSPLEALNKAVLPHLERAPCLVSFSGGRDSSAVLAVAAAVARREGLELPIPITLRFPRAPNSNEDGCQERVVRHLRLDEWRRLSIQDELDFVGPVAQTALERHGVLYPANSHSHLPMLQEAAGGTLLTGFEGDGIFDFWGWERAASVLARRVRPMARDALRVGLAFSPRPVRKKRLAARHRLDLPWLKPHVLAAVNEAFCEWCVEEPFRWDRRTRWWAQARYLRLGVESLELLGEQAGAAVAHPFLDRGFISTLARYGGWSGFGDRTRTMHALFGGLLPKKIVARRGKATFEEAFWGTHSRALTERWQGVGIPSQFVDESALRETWSAAEPNGFTALLLQAQWLATRAVA